MNGRVQNLSRWFFVAMGLLLLFSNIFRLNHQEDNRVRILGKPTIEWQYSALSTSSIDQIVDDGHYVYVLYGEHDGNVQVFETDGDYCYSVYFYTHLNGAFKISAHEGKLYVKDKRGNLYVIKDGICERFIKKSEATNLRLQLNFDNHSDTFFVHMGSVWKDNDTEAVCVIQRPLYSVMYQGNLVFLVTIMLCAVIGWIRFRSRQTTR